VLLPNEVLGREFHPGLATGVYVSATTWLRGGFESALGYLGLDRAAQPAEDEDRPPRIVRTFRAPDVFDYSRVLVAVPRDAPPIARDKDRFLDYVRRFVAGFGERTRGRMLVLFTNAADVRKVGDELSGHFRARSIGLYWQNMESASKEELADLFRARVDSVLLGVDTFWFGADFPGETLEYVVIVRLPYGVPDRYHHAQCAALGTGEQWRRIYLPRALAKFRQGFGRLMRRETDKGCVFVLDGRAIEPRHRVFLRELPIASEQTESSDEEVLGGARFVRGDTELCIREALAHMGLAPGLPEE
jgi:ATP-dependent DNA helicase DinG